MEQKYYTQEGEDWEVLATFLPKGWEGKARELGALRRARGFPNAEALLRTLMIHFAEGCSLRETAVRAKCGGIVSVSDVAVLKRLREAGEWLRWMAEGVMHRWIERRPGRVFGEDVRVRVVDGSTVQEPGATGTTWRIHYSIRLPSLRCDEVHVTSPDVGESFKRFTVGRGDVILGDRGYCTRQGIGHILDSGGGVLVRYHLKNLPLVDKNGAEWALLPRLRRLSGTNLGDWDVWLPLKRTMIPGRICAIKKSREAAERARRKVLRSASKEGRTVQPETLEAAAYTFAFTTLGRDRFRATVVLEIYRGRWQIEVVFKRLKSIIGLGHLKKQDLEAAKAWLHGKLLVAFLIQAMISAGDTFSPWGYAIPGALPTEPLPVAGNIADASPLKAGG